jgi:hypothetical protein
MAFSIVRVSDHSFVRVIGDYLKLVTHLKLNKVEETLLSRDWSVKCDPLEPQAFTSN